jgi:hypothetical protein
MEFKLISNWHEKRLICCLCGTDKSVKYETEIADVNVFVCNKCATRWNGNNPDNKYMATNFESVRHMKETIMSDESLSDMEKLKYVFRASKEELKANDPQLYYAILAVLDAAK